MDGPDDILGSGTVDDHHRSLVDHAIPNPACLLVSGIAEQDQFTTQLLSELRDSRCSRAGLDFELGSGHETSRRRCSHKGHERGKIEIFRCWMSHVHLG